MVHDKITYEVCSSKYRLWLLDETRTNAQFHSKTLAINS